MLLSIIIPTRNRSAYLAELVDSLLMQGQRSFAWEIIVVDNASTDNTRDVVQGKAELAPIPLRYVYEPRLGLHEGRHRGTREAIGEFLAFLDDDTVVAPGWMSGVDLILSKTADAVVSRILPRWEETPPGWLTELIGTGKFSYLTLLDLGDTPQQINPLYVWGASFFIRHSLVYDLGGFHPDGMPPGLIQYRGDGELGFFRVFKQQGYTAWYDPRSIAYHRVSAKRMTLEYLCQRSYNEGISDSYSQIREDHALYADKVVSPVVKESRTAADFMRRAREMSFADWIAVLQNRVRGIRRHFLPTGQERIEDRLLFARNAGWNFHRTLVETDPELLAFVLRRDYLD